MLNLLVEDLPLPQTLVLATGDGNDNDGVPFLLAVGFVLVCYITLNIVSLVLYFCFDVYLRSNLFSLQAVFHFQRW
jgi:hypothetical protein